MAQSGVVTILGVDQGPSGVKNNRPWAIHKIKASDGNVYDTFEAPLAQQARDSNGAQVTLDYEIRITNKNGTEYTNYDLKGVSLAQNTSYSAPGVPGDPPSVPIAVVAPVPAPTTDVAPSDFQQQKDARITRLSAARTAFDYSGNREETLSTEAILALASDIEHFANHGYARDLAPPVAAAPAQAGALPWDDAA